jgi:hypothetical protein
MVQSGTELGFSLSLLSLLVWGELRKASSSSEFGGCETLGHDILLLWI